MQALSDSQGAHIRIEPWDYRYYAEKVRKARYDVDMNQVKPYLQLDHIKDGMFWAAGQLYGFQFVQAERHRDLRARHAGVRGARPRRDAGGASGTSTPTRGTGKNSGAWMSDYRPQQKLGRDMTCPSCPTTPTS